MTLPPQFRAFADGTKRKRCAVCGQMFPMRGFRTLYCLECKEAKVREWAAAYRRRRRARPGERERENALSRAAYAKARAAG